MKILMLVNWKIEYCKEKPADKQPPDYKVEGKGYWFYRYFKNKPEVDVIDIRSFPWLENFERNKLHFYIWQAIRASITAAALMYLTKIATSLIGGGQYFSKILDLPTFFFLFAVVISACRKMDLNGKFYVRLRNWSETIYFVHMYFVALCALVLYKSDYHNFKPFFIAASGSFIISWLTSLYKERKNK